MSNLDAAIEEINRVLICNKSREVEEVYLLNAVRYINEFKEQPELNENQQIVLDRLKEQVQSTEEKPFRTIFWLMNQAAWDRLSDLRNPIINLNKEQQIQVLRSYTDWLEQEAQR